MYGSRRAPLRTRPPEETLGLTVGPDLVRRVALLGAVLLAVLAAGHLAYLLAPSVRSLEVLDLGREQTVGTWVASTLHLVCAGLSAAGALVARREGGRWSGNWWLLAGAFLVMSVDETAAVHDRVALVIKDQLDTTGALLYPWVLVAGVLGLAFLLLQVRFLRSLHRPTGFYLVVAGVVFVAGAAGLEMVEGLLASPGGPGAESVPFRLAILAEELLELGALLGVVCILLSHLATWLDTPRLSLSTGDTSSAAGPRGLARTGR